MENSPTAKDFIKSFWKWFKRNYGNIVLTLILMAISAIAFNLGDNLWEIKYHLKSIDDYIFELK
jgi:hypothetical protein